MTIACSIYSLPCFWDKCLVLLYGVQQLWNFYEQRDCGHVPSDAVGKIQQVISIRQILLVAPTTQPEALFVCVGDAHV